MTMAATPLNDPPSLPLYIFADQIAQVTGLSGWVTRKLLKDLGIARKVGGRWATTRHLLRDKNREIYDALMDRLYPDPPERA